MNGSFFVRYYYLVCVFKSIDIVTAHRDVLCRAYAWKMNQINTNNQPNIFSLSKINRDCANAFGRDRISVQQQIRCRANVTNSFNFSG